MPKSSINKSAFVRDLGPMPAKDVVAKAKQRGISLSVAQVYTIRSNANRRAAKGSAGLVAKQAKRGRPAKSTSALHASIGKLASGLVDGILRAVRGASLDEILSLR
jgi:hypothetical protein